MRRGASGTIIRVALALIAVLLLAIVLAQLFLPGIAANRISSRVARYGSVQKVSVKAWPAVELLWGSADSVRVRASRLSLSPAQTARLLWEARGASNLELSAGSLREGPLALTDANLRKRGDALSAHASITRAAVKAALPEGFEVALLGSGGGKVRVRASGGLFGVGASVDAVAGASEGKLIARPLEFPLNGLAMTLFSDRHLYVQGVGASAVTGPGGVLGYRLVITARLR
jgi:hypothetical protein